MTQNIPSGEKFYWVVVADEAKATFYAQETKRSPLRELYSLDNATARKKTAGLISDRGGRSFDSEGRGRHTMTKEKNDPKKQAAIAFAKKIIERIVTAKQNDNCRDYALIAAPGFLGLLRHALAIAGIFDPYISIDKDLVGQDIKFIEKKLLERVAR